MIIDEISGTKIKFHNGKVIDLIEVFDVDTEDLSENFARQAAIYAYFATLQADAERQLAISKFDVDQEYATSDEHWRHYKDKREEKYTEAVIKSLVIRDEDYVSKEMQRIQLEYEVNLLKAVTRALSQRADMLISLGAMTRQELAMTGMSMKEQQYDNIPKDLKTILDVAAKKRRDQV